MTNSSRDLSGASSRLSPRDRKRLRRNIEADLAQIRQCQAGNHRMETTQSPGVVVCRLCRIVGVCPWCGHPVPARACISVCPEHAPLVAWQVTNAQKEEEGRPLP